MTESIGVDAEQAFDSDVQITRPYRINHRSIAERIDLFKPHAFEPVTSRLVDRTALATAETDKSPVDPNASETHTCDNRPRIQKMPIVSPPWETFSGVKSKPRKLTI